MNIAGVGLGIGFSAYTNYIPAAGNTKSSAPGQASPSPLPGRDRTPPVRGLPVQGSNAPALYNTSAVPALPDRQGRAGGPVTMFLSKDGDRFELSIPLAYASQARPGEITKPGDIIKPNEAANPFDNAGPAKSPDIQMPGSGLLDSLKPEGECQTCANRKYVDGSNDASVSYQTPTKIDPNTAGAKVAAHEQEHVRNEQANAARDGREIVSQTVVMHYDTCPECGKTYVSGGTTRTTSIDKGEKEDPFKNQQSQQSGETE